jgi:ATP/ADP translocase
MEQASQDRLRILLPCLGLFLLTAAFIIAKTGRDALFFQERGIFQLPLAFIMMGTASVPLAVIFVRIMKTFGARPTRVGALVFAAAVMGSSAPLLEPGDSPLLFNTFIFIPAIFAILFASLWLLASDLFENSAKREAARVFSKIGASSLAGGMTGGLAAKGLAPFVQAKWLILIGALVVLCVAALVTYIHERFPSNIAAKKNGDKNTQPGFRSVLANPYALTLIFIAMSGALVGLLIDFQFYAAASKSNANFFANFYILLNLGSLLLQLFAAPKIQDKIGLRGGLMILPMALIGGATFATAAATALSRSVLRVTEGGLRSSIHRSVWEQAFIPVESGQRSVAKIAADGVAARLAEGIGATAIFLWLRQVAPSGMSVASLDTSWMVWVTLAIVIVWLLITQKLRVQVKQDASKTRLSTDIECERFPDQCPCTTELGKGIA